MSVCVYAKSKHSIYKQETVVSFYEAYHFLLIVILWEKHFDAEQILLNAIEY